MHAAGARQNGPLVASQGAPSARADSHVPANAVPFVLHHPPPVHSVKLPSAVEVPHAPPAVAVRIFSQTVLLVKSLGSDAAIAATKPGDVTGQRNRARARSR